MTVYALTVSAFMSPFTTALRTLSSILINVQDPESNCLLFFLYSVLLNY
jgi:hypothetical protein